MKCTGGFDLCENDTNINNLGIAPKLGKGVLLDLEMGPRHFGATFLRYHIDKYRKYIKFRNSFVINCCLVSKWKLIFSNAESGLKY